MTIGVTGATGALGSLVLAGLLKHIPAESIVAIARDSAKAATWVRKGIQVRIADYDDPASLKKAFVGIDRLLLISGSEFGKRVTQHQAVVDAAKIAGVGLLAYTSLVAADTSSNVAAPDHKATEAYIRESGLDFVFLRHNWYTENYFQTLLTAAQTGVIIGSAGSGSVASATRGDYAEAAVAVLTGNGHANQIYELTGDTSWTYSELALAAGVVAGRQVTYQDVSTEEHRKTLAQFGVPEPAIDIIVAIDRSIAVGTLAKTSPDLHRLIGRPTTSLVDGLRPALSGSA